MGRAFRIGAGTAAVIGLGLFVGPLRACLWDSDTLETEAKGMPEVVQVITGRFERNPPLYYEMRLSRAYDRVKADPADLGAYDDAGVACDRLGRGDEAIEWMEKKQAQLDESEAGGQDVKEHRYRYLANLGTFEAHRWFRNGADRANLSDIKAARDHIAEAIALNPNAHFGREPYQLRFLEWVISDPRYVPGKDFLLPTFLSFHTGAPESKDAHAAVEGLTGLIALGNAWESVDVFNALVGALEADGRRTSVALLAQWRGRELIEAGKASVVSGAPKGDDLPHRLQQVHGMVAQVKQLEQLFRALRDNADAWHAVRTAFMTKRLEQGSHPDTDPHFWDGYREVALPSLALPAENGPASRRVAGRSRERLNPASVALGAVGAASAGAAIVVRSRRARRSRLAKAKPPADDGLA